MFFFGVHHDCTPRKKSNKDKYIEASEKYTLKSAEYLATKNKETKTAIKLKEMIDKLDATTERLAGIIDVPNLSDTTKTHLCDLYTRNKYNRREDIKSKYLEKGLELEEDAITQYCIHTGEFHKKNKERRENEFIVGELDYIKEDTVYDAKVNWSIFQFTRVAARPIKPLYHWQLDGYMWLWKAKKGRLVYSLLNTPDHLVQREVTRLMYDLFGEKINPDNLSPLDKDLWDNAVEELKRNHNYDDIPLEEKLRTFDVQYSDERIGKLKKRVLDCRTYLNNIGKMEAVVGEEEESESIAA